MNHPIMAEAPQRRVRGLLSRKECNQDTEERLIGCTHLEETRPLVMSKKPSVHPQKHRLHLSVVLLAHFFSAVRTGVTLSPKQYLWKSVEVAFVLRGLTGFLNFKF